MSTTNLPPVSDPVSDRLLALAWLKTCDMVQNACFNDILDAVICQEDVLTTNDLMCQRLYGNLQLDWGNAPRLIGHFNSRLVLASIKILHCPTRVLEDLNEPLAKMLFDSCGPFLEELKLTVQKLADGVAWTEALGRELGLKLHTYVKAYGEWQRVDIVKVPARMIKAVMHLEGHAQLARLRGSLADSDAAEKTLERLRGKYERHLQQQKQ